jgi:peroxiredoxin
MPSSLVDRSFSEYRAKAFLPFAVLCVALTAVYISVTVDIHNRPIPKPQEESAQQERQPSPMEGKPAPMFELPDLNGKTVKLADYAGKVLFINIWATWCVPCREEMPSMEALYKQIKGPGFEMLAVSVDEAGASAVKPFMEELGLTFPALLDTKSEVAALYKTTGVPETFIVNKDGIIIHHVVGPTDWSRPEVVGLLKQYISRAKD